MVIELTVKGGDVVNGKLQVTDEERAVLNRIEHKFNEIEDAFSKISAVLSHELLQLHNEGHSLNHCIRWGRQAVQEINDAIGRDDIQIMYAGKCWVIVLPGGDFADQTFETGLELAIYLKETGMGKKVKNLCNLLPELQQIALSDPEPFELNRERGK